MHSARVPIVPRRQLVVIKNEKGISGLLLSHMRIELRIELFPTILEKADSDARLFPTRTLFLGPVAEFMLELANGMERQEWSPERKIERLPQWLDLIIEHRAHHGQLRFYSSFTRAAMALHGAARL